MADRLLFDRHGFFERKHYSATTEEDQEPFSVQYIIVVIQSQILLRGSQFPNIELSRLVVERLRRPKQFSDMNEAISFLILRRTALFLLQSIPLSPYRCVVLFPTQ